MARCGFSKLDFLPNTNWSAFYFFFPLPIITPIFWILSSFYWCFVKDIFLVKCFISDSDRGSLRFSRRVCCLEVMSIVSSSRPESIIAPDLVHTFKEEFDFFFFKFIFLVSIFFKRFLYLVPTLFIFVFSFSTFFYPFF